jgi:hypothetical protein
MKYFTPEGWIGFNSARRDSAFQSYDRRLESYRKQLSLLLPRLNPTARRFFREVCLLHDGTLLRMEAGDHIDGAGQGGTRIGVNDRRASVRLLVKSENGESIYTLNYTGVRRVEVPGETVLFPSGKRANFGDWGYDELTSAKEGRFRHEVLFASGSTITIEFKKFSFLKSK